jgi:small subunit ribosomal protein S5
MRSTDGLEEKTLLIKRVSKKTTGGNYATFASLVAVGDKNGRVGIGVGRGLEVPQSLKKAAKKARKNMITVPVVNSSIPHALIVEYKSSKILLKPAPEGTGLKIGGVARTLFDLAGIYNASGKVIGSRNKVSNAYAIIKALQSFKSKKNTASAKQSSTNLNTK